MKVVNCLRCWSAVCSLMATLHYALMFLLREFQNERLHTLILSAEQVRTWTAWDVGLLSSSVATLCLNFTAKRIWKWEMSICISPLVCRTGKGVNCLCCWSAISSSVARLCLGLTAKRLSNTCILSCLSCFFWQYCGLGSVLWYCVVWSSCQD